VKDYVSSLSITDRYAGLRRGRETLRIGSGPIHKIVVMRACVRSMANEQLRETRLVRITRRGTTIRLNPFWMLRPERIMHLALKLRVTRNFSDGD
jgi:hypothetical protein